MAKEELFNKHKTNFDAGVLLIEGENAYYASSIHCFYYSIFQLTDYVLRDVLKLSKKEIKERTSKYLATGSGNRGSHEVIIMTMYKELIDATDTTKANFYKDKTLELKRLRNQSDYKNVYIDESISKLAHNLCEEIKTNIYQDFNIE